ncbi:MAG: hypothetical protein IKS55_07800 [Oscillospiraceae bacterium]|nr:hypothetical protein [Oscillospiraceae bacterium]
MKCPYCGAETRPPICEYCGSEIVQTSNVVNNVGDTTPESNQRCSKCGSRNITFRREKQGEVREKNVNRVVYRTVGVCRDCGCTWFADGAPAQPKKRKTWLWVLGWIFIFPVPLTILILRKKDMNMFLRALLIALAWIVFFGFAYSNESSSTSLSTSSTKQSPPQTSAASTASGKSSTNEKPDFLLSWNEAGEYGEKLTLDEGTELENSFYAFYLPEGTYSVINLSDSITTQVTEYGGIKAGEKWDEYITEGCETPLVLAPGEGIQKYKIKDGQFIKLSDGGTNIGFTLVDESKD